MNAQIDMLEKVMDYAAMRQQALANNVANANTPLYKRLDVEFGDALISALESGKPIGSGEAARVVVDTLSASRPDGNNVSLQKELGAMTDNSLLFQLASKAISRKFAGISKAISGKG